MLKIDLTEFQYLLISVYFHVHVINLNHEENLMARRRKKIPKPDFEGSTSIPESVDLPKSTSTKPTSTNPTSYNVSAMRQEVIIPGFGMSVPAFRTLSVNDEETYIPLGLVTGHFVPVGIDAGSELYPQLGTMFCQRLVTQLRNLGYANEITTAQVRKYLNDVAKLVQMHQYITEIRGLSDYSDIHSSAPVSAFVTNGINGRLVAIHRRLNKLLSSLSFPKQWVDIYQKGFGITTLSDSPFGPLRMFIPKEFEVEASNLISATHVADTILDYINDFYSIAPNVELASILPNVLSSTATLPEKVASYPRFVQGTVNNLLNMSYYDGSLNDPNAEDTETVRYFYRRSVVPEGTLTYAPDANILTTAQGTVWLQNLDIVEGTLSRWAINNNGVTISITNGASRWANFGCIWEADIGLSGAPGPSVAYVNTTFTNVATGVADMMFNNV